MHYRNSILVLLPAVSVSSRIQTGTIHSRTVYRSYSRETWDLAKFPKGCFNSPCVSRSVRCIIVSVTRAPKQKFAHRGVLYGCDCIHKWLVECSKWLGPLQMSQWMTVHICRVSFVAQQEPSVSFWTVENCRSQAKTSIKHKVLCRSFAKGIIDKEQNVERLAFVCNLSLLQI